jgi:hypothetical protein
MHNREAAMIEMLSAVQTFLDEKKTLITPINESGTRKVLDDIVAQLTAQAVDQRAAQTGSMGETARQARLRRELLRRRMDPVAAIAKTLSPQLPELSAFAVPKADTPSTRLIAAANAMADSAKPHEAALVAGGLPPDFIEHLQAAAELLKESLGIRTQHNGRAKGATRAMKPLVRRGVATVRVLDALISVKLEGNDRLLGEWEKARSMRRKTGPAQGSAPSAESSGGTPVTPIVQVPPAVPSTSTAIAAPVTAGVSAA